jgi:hypothetical protein
MISDIKLRNERTIAQGIAEHWVYGIVVVVKWVYVDGYACVVWV